MEKVICDYGFQIVSGGNYGGFSFWMWVLGGVNISEFVLKLCWSGVVID